MQEMLKPLETIEDVGIQNNEMVQNGYLLQLPLLPKRNRRVLIINEEIEMELDESYESESSGLHISQTVEVQNDTCGMLQLAPIENVDCLNYDINLKSDDIEVSELDLVNETEDKTLCKTNGIQVPKQKIISSQNYQLEEYLNRMFRKIAPKECLSNTVVDLETWRVNPPKRFKKKYALSSLMVNFRERKTLLKKKPVKQFKNQTSNRPALKSKNGSSIDPTNSENWKVDSYLKSLTMEDLKEGEVTVPAIVENEVAEISLNIQETENDVQLIICPYCNYKNPKETILRRHLILNHLETRKCAQCDFHSSSWKLMTLHLSKHNKNLFQCPLCNEIIKSSLMKNHIVLRHSKTILEKCRSCDFKVKSKSFISRIISLRKHVLSCHSKGKEDEYNCPVCDFTTSLDLDMKSHIYLSHRDLKGNFFRCVECTFIAASITSLLNHVGVHKKKKKSYCVYCKFSNCSVLWMNLHKRTHNPALFRCPYCSFRNRGNYAIKYHIQKWHKNNSFRSLLKQKSN